MQPITILVYNDEGASQTCVQSLLATFHLKLQYYGVEVKTISTISSDEILYDKLLIADCLIMPGGADLPYCRLLNGDGNKKIRQFVADGNVYIGICAGAYYATAGISFTGDGYRIAGDRELGLYKGQAIGSIPEYTGSRYYDETAATKAIVQLKSDGNIIGDFYYHGGSYFIDGDVYASFAAYNMGKVAAVSGDFGKGKYLLSGVHFELCATIYEQHLNDADNTQKKRSLAATSKEEKLLKLLKEPDYGSFIYKKIATLFQ